MIYRIKRLYSDNPVPQNSDPGIKINSAEVTRFGTAMKRVTGMMNNSQQDITE